MSSTEVITDDMRDKWKHKAEIIIESVDVCQLVLNEWEVGFMDTIDEMLSRDRDLSLTYINEELSNDLLERVQFYRTLQESKGIHKEDHHSVVKKYYNREGLSLGIDRRHRFGSSPTGLNRRKINGI